MLQDVFEAVPVTSVLVGLVVFSLLSSIFIAYVDKSRMYSSMVSPDYEKESFKRKNLDRLRMKSGQFPKPYPNGWYRVCGSSELPKGRVIAATCCGKEMVVFRGNDGKAGVLDAFCPHLGTHLGHGGTVVGNNIVCPYHSWEFDVTGKCHTIPYCSKDMSNSSRVNAKKYECRERLSIIFVWYHAGGKAPEYELTVLDEIEDPKNGFRHVITEFVGDWMCHNMEPSHNSADWYHFKTVHKWLCQDMNYEGIKGMYIEHGCNVRYGTDSSQSAKYDPTSENIHPTRYELKMWTKKLKLFGLITMPSMFNHTMDTIVQVQGPMTQVIWSVSC
jgi:phenylpropionate dioxygenase-like ring-hydroxylating dioxygenase large terminal subunit